MPAAVGSDVIAAPVAPAAPAADAARADAEAFWGPR
jgi:hypothetical protein